MATAQDIMAWVAELLGQQGQGLPNSLTGRALQRPPPLLPGSDAGASAVMEDLARTPNLDALASNRGLVNQLRPPQPAAVPPDVLEPDRRGQLERTAVPPMAERDPFPETATDVPDSMRLRVPPMAPRNFNAPPFTTEVRREPPPAIDEEAIIRGATEQDTVNRRLTPPPMAPRTPGREALRQPGLWQYIDTALAGMAGGRPVLSAVGERAEARNATYDALVQRGASEELARAITLNPAQFQPIMPSLFSPRTSIVNNRLVDTTTGRMIADFSSHILGPEQRLVAGTGQTIAEGGPRRLSAEQLERMGGQGDTYATVGRLDRSWNRAYTMPGTVWGGDIRDWLARNGLTNNPNATRAAEWWQEYRRHSELVERHGLFGAALTPTEQASWQRADIHPNMDPGLVERNLQARREIMHGVMRRRASALVGEGHSLESVARGFGLTVEELQAEKPPAVRREGAGNTQLPPTTDAVVPDRARPPPITGTPPPPRITTDAEYRALRSGARYIDPEGRERTKR